MGEDHRNARIRGENVVVAGKELSVSQSVPMRPEDRQRLRVLAAENGVGPGLLGRALIKAGIDMLDDPRVQARLTGEIEAEQARQSAAGQAAMKARWHGADAPAQE
ncbi:hypothetical protein [Brevibacterium sp. 'Marine']|uniref:hypothetical protein n=1 Tax=Brevibacterium sp. 'Marine' TaxID=2725563 RepID=UPI00145D6BBB|nr:hypothetical protein [Brevibacterium sp. 'Marine']